MIIKASKLKVGHIIKDFENKNDLKIVKIEILEDEKKILLVGDNLGWGDSFWCKVNPNDLFDVLR